MLDGTQEEYLAREKFFRRPLHQVPPAHFYRWLACLEAVRRLREEA